MDRYERLGNMSGGKLGSFEGHGVSNTFGGQFGDAVSDLPRNRQYLNQVKADLNLARRSKTSAAGAWGGAPQSWQYWEFKGKSANDVDALAYGKIADLNQKISAGEGSSGSSGDSYSASTDSSGGSDTSAGEILTGMAAIFAPLAQLGVGIYSTHQQAEMERMRRERGITDEPGRGRQVIKQKSTTGVIIAAVVVVIVMMGMMMMMNKNKNKGVA
jgi:hypothetical protein